MTQQPNEDIILAQLEAQTIVLMRIYDVALTFLQQNHPLAAAELLQLHADGTILGPAPAFNGTFAFNELNEEDTGDE